MCFCNALSIGQLLFQISQPCTHNGFAQTSLPFGVMLAETMLEDGNYPNSTSLTLLQIFNCLVLEQGTSYIFLGRSLTLASNLVREVLSLVRFGLFQTPAFMRRVSDDILYITLC